MIIDLNWNLIRYTVTRLCQDQFDKVKFMHYDNVTVFFCFKKFKRLAIKNYKSYNQTPSQRQVR